MKTKSAQVNGTAMGILNPHDPYWGRFESGGSALGGVDGLRKSEKERDLYSDLAEARRLAIKKLGSMTFGIDDSIDSKGRSLQPIDILAARSKFADKQAFVLSEQRRNEYGAKPDPYGAFSRKIETVHTFTYEPRDPYTFTPRFGF